MNPILERRRRLPPYRPLVRRLLLLVSAIVLIDTMLYAALVPLLPGYAEEFGLGKDAAGLLVAAFAFGVLVGAVPSGVASARFGAKRTVLAGLVLMSAASLGFAFAADAWTLGLARLAQGLGSALSWAGGLTWLVSATPRERRGEVLGAAIGVAIFGALLGPVVGAAAAVLGTRPAFSGVALLAGLLVAWAARTAEAPEEGERATSLLRALGEYAFLGSLWLMALPALLFGVLVVLVPLELASFGFGAVAIGAVFFASSAIEAAVSPLVGRVSDRRGRLLPLRVALVASGGAFLALAAAGSAPVLVALLVLAGVSSAAFYAPASALISDRAERVGLAQGVAFGVMNAAWALGNVVGPALGGTLAAATGDAVPYLVMAATCGATLAALRLRRGLAL